MGNNAVQPAVDPVIQKMAKRLMREFIANERELKLASLHVLCSVTPRELKKLRRIFNRFDPKVAFHELQLMIYVLISLILSSKVFDNDTFSPFRVCIHNPPTVEQVS